MPTKRGGVLQCPIAADELLPITGPIGLASSKISERNARSERCIPRIAREHRAGVGIDLGRHELRGCTARRTKHPLDVSRQREAPETT